MRFIDQFSVLLLDMNGTFVFGHDRFGPDQDYFSTYQLAGGRTLDRDNVFRIVNVTFDALRRAYCAPERINDFPTVAEVLLEYGGVEQDDLFALEAVFAVHELGSVPPAHDEFLRDIARTHDLGIVSNLWSAPDRWLSAFRESGLLAVFKTAVFSSEGRSIKPSRAPFDRALAAFPHDASVLFIGDSLERDIIPAKALGLSTAWIAPSGSTSRAADVVIESLPELATRRLTRHAADLRDPLKKCW